MKKKSKKTLKLSCFKIQKGILHGPIKLIPRAGFEVPFYLIIVELVTSDPWNFHNLHLRLPEVMELATLSKLAPKERLKKGAMDNFFIFNFRKKVIFHKSLRMAYNLKCNYQISCRRGEYWVFHTLALQIYGYFGNYAVLTIGRQMAATNRFHKISGLGAAKIFVFSSIVSKLFTYLLSVIRSECRCICIIYLLLKMIVLAL